MRKYCCILVLLFCFSIISSAQETRFGAKVGLNYASIVGDLTEGIKFRLSGHAGVFLEIGLSDKFAFRPELLYSSQGFQFSSDLLALENNGVTFDETDIRTNVQLNYLIVPLVGKFVLGENFDVKFGPQFGFLLNQVTKIKYPDERDNTIPNARNSISGRFQLDYGLVVGLGIKLSDNFSLSSRFYLGLRNRLNGLEGLPQNYNAAIQFSLDYSIL